MNLKITHLSTVLLLSIALSDQILADDSSQEPLDFSTGSYNSVELNGAWNRILIDNTLAARLSFFGGDSEGHIDNIGLAGGDAYLTQKLSKLQKLGGSQCL